jgi:hypothetical protein
VRTRRPFELSPRSRNKPVDADDSSESIVALHARDRRSSHRCRDGSGFTAGRACAMRLSRRCLALHPAVQTATTAVRAVIRFDPAGAYTRLLRTATSTDTYKSK